MRWAAVLPLLPSRLVPHEGFAQPASTRGMLGKGVHESCNILRTVVPVQTSPGQQAPGREMGRGCAQSGLPAKFRTRSAVTARSEQRPSQQGTEPTEPFLFLTSLILLHRPTDHRPRACTVQISLTRISAWRPRVGAARNHRIWASAIFGVAGSGAPRSAARPAEPPPARPAARCRRCSERRLRWLI